MTQILAIPADASGNKLFIKNPVEENGHLIVEAMTTFDNTPFTKVELFLANGGEFYVILTPNGSVAFQFVVGWLDLIEEEEIQQ